MRGIVVCMSKQISLSHKVDFLAPKKCQHGLRCHSADHLFLLLKRADVRLSYIWWFQKIGGIYANSGFLRF